jgi:hypothetical protein
MVSIYTPIQKGFVDIYGIKWWQAQIDTYNRISKEIHDKQESGHYVSQERLNQRHRTYCVPFYLERRKTVKVIFENGGSLVTDINGTVEEIREYYLNNYFNVPGIPDNDTGPLTKGKTVIFL